MSGRIGLKQHTLEDFGLLYSYNCALLIDSKDSLRIAADARSSSFYCSCI
jgi:hypothetical protein